MMVRALLKLALALTAFLPVGCAETHRPTPAPAAVTASPLPSGYLRIQTEPPLPSDAILGCDLAGLSDVRLARSGEDLLVVNIHTGRQTTIVWPYGFAGRVVGDRAELLAPDGSVVAREGDVLDLGGGSGPPFHVCQINGKIYVNGQTW